jgi:hypothetical protein
MTCHEGIECEYRYISTLYLASALDGGGWLTPRPGTFTPGNYNEQEGGWAATVGTGAENFASTGIQSPDRPSRSDSLYRLSYAGPLEIYI